MNASSRNSSFTCHMLGVNTRRVRALPAPQSGQKQRGSRPEEPGLTLFAGTDLRRLRTAVMSCLLGSVMFTAAGH